MQPRGQTSLTTLRQTSIPVWTYSWAPKNLVAKTLWLALSEQGDMFRLRKSFLASIKAAVPVDKTPALI